MLKEKRSAATNRTEQQSMVDMKSIVELILVRDKWRAHRKKVQRQDKQTAFNNHINSEKNKM
jgi:hypothetical protein